jgi:hypothetical protein
MVTGSSETVTFSVLFSSDFTSLETGSAASVVFAGAPQADNRIDIRHVAMSNINIIFLDFFNVYPP